MENIFDNIFDNSKTQSTGTFRPRKSIFSSTKPKPDNDQHVLLVNGQSIHQQNIKPNTTPQFYQNRSSSVDNSHNQNIVRDPHVARRTTGSFYLPQNPINKVIITNPSATQCIRPSSVGRRSFIMPQTQTIQQPLMISNHSRVIPSQSSILTNSRIIPSQTSNVIVGSTLYPTVNHLKKKSVIFDGRPPSQKFIYKPLSPAKIRHPQYISQIVPQISTVIIRDDPKTLSQLNKLSSLNQFLNNQYNCVNNELNYFKNKTCQKQIVDDRVFLQRSLNRIDDIFLRQTNQALFKLQQISRFSSSKGFKRSPSSKGFKKSTGFDYQIQRSQSPNFIKIGNNSSRYTPMKNLQQMRNSSYLGCHYLNPSQISQIN